MRKLCLITTAVIMSCFCLSCDTEGGAERNVNNPRDDIQYTKADYLLELGRFEGLDEDTEWQIVQAYFKKLQSDGGHGDLTINDIRVEQFYGWYCPAYLLPDVPNEQFDLITAAYHDPKNRIVAVVRMSPTDMDYGTEQRDVIINIYSRRMVVRYYDNSTILLWDKGNLYDIEKDFNYVNPSLIPQDFMKIINRHNGLNFETDTIIRESIGKCLLTGWPIEEYVFISMKYLGAYNGYTALALYSGAHSPAVYEQIIGDVLFSHHYYEMRVYAWKDGEIYKLEDLYEQGLITREDLVEMAYFHYAFRDGEDSYQYHYVF